MAKKKELTIVNRRQRTHVNEDGSTVQKPLPLYLDGRGTPAFVMLLPEYVQDALGVPAEAKAPTADEAEREYCKLVSQYVEHSKNAKAVKVLMVSYSYETEVASNNRTHWHGREHADRRANIGIEYRVAFVSNGKVYTAKEVWPKITKTMIGGSTYETDDRSQPSQLVPGALEPYTKESETMPYREELQAKLDMVVNALNQASLVLKGLDDAKDRGAALLGLGRMLLAAPPTGQSDVPALTAHS